MKNFKLFVAAPLLLILAVQLTACKEHMEHDYFLIEVDSISVPNTVEINKPFGLRFYGYIGHNGCYSFDRFVVDKQDKLITIEAWGRKRIASDKCNEVLVNMEGEKLDFVVDNPGNYLINIKQPGNTHMELTVTGR